MTNKKIEFSIEGMHCGSCAIGIQMALSTKEGVAKSSVDYNGKKASVEFDPDKISLDDLKKPIEDMGYKVV